jgi:hypothetical protein
MTTETAKGVRQKTAQIEKKGSPGMSDGGKKCLVGVKWF